MGRKPQRRSKGFTLVAALLLLLLLSGVAVGLMYMVNGESRMGGSDMNYNIAYYAAESGMEKLTADLASLYESAQTPTTNSVTNLANFPPTTLGSMTFTEKVTWTWNAGREKGNRCDNCDGKHYAQSSHGSTLSFRY